MKIIQNAKTVFSCPTGILINNISACIIRAGIKRKGIHLTRKQIMMLVRELRNYKKTHPDWNPIEITENNGDCIIIEI